MHNLNLKKLFYFENKNFSFLHVYAIFIEMMQRERIAIILANNKGL